MIRQVPPLSRVTLRHVSLSTPRSTSHLARIPAPIQKNTRSLCLQKRADLALALRKPFSTSLQSYAAAPGNPYDKIDTKHEEVLEHEKLEQHPEEVTATSSVHLAFQEKGVDEPEKDVDMLAGVRSDLVGIEDTMARESC